MNRQTKSWLIFIVSSVFVVAYLLTFAQASYGIQMNMTQQANEKVNDAYKKEQEGNKVTGMASGGEGTKSMCTMIAAILMTIAIIWLHFSAAWTIKSKAVCAVTGWNWAFAICIGMIIITIVLYYLAFTMMKKASEASSGERSDEDDEDLSSGVNNQTIVNTGQ